MSPYLASWILPSCNWTDVSTTTIISQPSSEGSISICAPMISDRASPVRLRSSIAPTVPPKVPARAKALPMASGSALRWHRYRTLLYLLTMEPNSASEMSIRELVKSKEISSFPPDNILCSLWIDPRQERRWQGPWTGL